MIGGASGCICNGGNGPSRVSETPSSALDPAGPAAAVAGSGSPSKRTGAVAVDAHSPMSRSGPVGRFGAESASRTVVLDQLTDQLGVLPLPGDGEGAGQNRRRNVSGPPRSRVGVGDRVPHRVDGQCRRHLELRGLFEFGRRTPEFRTVDLGPDDAQRSACRAWVSSHVSEGSPAASKPRSVNASARHTVPR